MSGTVNISRSIWTDAAFKAEPFTEREAFIWLIMDASYKPREKRAGNVTVKLQRGQLISSVRFMAEAWNWSKSRVDRYLDRLEKRDMIGTDTGTGVNVITICKYEEYQNAPKSSGTAELKKRDSSGTAAGQQRDKPNTDEIQDKVKREAKASPKKGTRLSEDWVLPKAWGEWAVDDGFAVDAIRAEADNFKDYWISKPGAAAVKLDWLATWRVWMRKSNHGKRTNTTGRGPVGRSNPHGALFAGFGAIAGDDDAGRSEPSGSMRDVTPTGAAQLDDGPDCHDAGPFLCVSVVRG